MLLPSWTPTIWVLRHDLLPSIYALSWDTCKIWNELTHLSRWPHYYRVHHHVYVQVKSGNVFLYCLLIRRFKCWVTTSGVPTGGMSTSRVPTNDVKPMAQTEPPVIAIFALSVKSCVGQWESQSIFGIVIRSLTMEFMRGPDRIKAMHATTGGPGRHLTLLTHAMITYFAFPVFLWILTDSSAHCSFFLMAKLW